MKKQTYIVFFQDKEGKEVDFERFSCKRLDTVINGIYTLWNNGLFRALTKTATQALVYKSEGGIEGLEPIATVALPPEK